MTPKERALYMLTRFAVGDAVEIDDSSIIGEVVGIQIKIGCEDTYLLAYRDATDSPQRIWWPDSSLEPADEPDDSNIICFSCAKRERSATLH